MTEQKWLTRGGKSSGGQKKYHTHEECRYMKRTDEIREPTESELQYHDYQECDICRRMRE